MIDWNSYEQKFNEKFEHVLNWMHSEFNKIRVGRANPMILDTILVDAYDEKMHFNQIANISVPEPRVLVIKPYDKSLLKNIAAAISAANIGIHPQTDADLVRLTFPAPTEEMRKDIVKKIKQIAEQAKVDVRRIRQSLQDDYKKDENVTDDDKKYFDTQLDTITRKANSKIDEDFANRQSEILTI